MRVCCLVPDVTHDRQRSQQLPSQSRGTFRCEHRAGMSSDEQSELFDLRRREEWLWLGRVVVV